VIHLLSLFHYNLVNCNAGVYYTNVTFGVIIKNQGLLYLLTTIYFTYLFFNILNYEMGFQSESYN